MFKPKDFRSSNDDERARISLLILELCSVIERYCGNFREPKATFIVAMAIAHGCSIGTPFGISTISRLTHYSRRKVYDIIDDLMERGMVRKGNLPGVPYPVYIRNVKHEAQKETAPALYKDLQELFRHLA